ncbi:MAG: DinB family protein [Gemmatimonadetes bacterium]|nr:DinB family protein [Gemmatimonadota bacterium]
MAPGKTTTSRGEARTTGSTDVESVLAALAATPKAIARLARGRPDALLHRPPGPDAWSARDVVAHLRACADVWGRSIHRMLAETDPTIRYVSPRGWIRKTDFLEQTFPDSLRAFTSDRASLLKTLRTLGARDWARGATFTGTTAGREATVYSYALRIADHELGHVDQIRRALGDQAGVRFPAASARTRPPAASGK